VKTSLPDSWCFPRKGNIKEAVFLSFQTRTTRVYRMSSSTSMPSVCISMMRYLHHCR